MVTLQRFFESYGFGNPWPELLTIFTDDEIEDLSIILYPLDSNEVVLNINDRNDPVIIELIMRFSEKYEDSLENLNHFKQEFTTLNLHLAQEGWKCLTKLSSLKRGHFFSLMYSVPPGFPTCQSCTYRIIEDDMDYCQKGQWVEGKEVFDNTCLGASCPFYTKKINHSHEEN